MRLSALVPTLSAELVSALDECGIKSEADLIFSTPLDTFNRLPVGTISLDNLNNAISLVASLVSAPGIRGDTLALQAQKQDFERDGGLMSGVETLDGLLDGFGGHRVLEVSGDVGSGKTTLALNIVLRHLSIASRSSVLWIDATGEFSADRAVQILAGYDGQGAATALERLQVSLAFDIEAAYDALETLRLALSGLDSDSDRRTRCIVIDTITPLIGPHLSAVSSRGHAIMTEFLRQLRAFAQTFSLTVLVLNNATSSNGPNPNSNFITTVKKPALGPSFTFMTDATLWLSRSDNVEEDGSVAHVAEVFRSKSTPSNTWCTFKINNGVLRAA